MTLRSDVAFTPAVKRAQAERGSRDAYERVMRRKDWPNTIDESLAQFIADRDSFYMATASAGGQPYIQHRGGPKGFLKVLDNKRLAFADYSGNHQYVSLGNLSENDRTCLFLMDYPRRIRVKIWGRALFVEGDEVLLNRVADPNYSATPERALVFTIAAWDRNCPKHITPRYTMDELEDFGMERVKTFR